MDGFAFLCTEKIFNTHPKFKQDFNKELSSLHQYKYRTLNKIYKRKLQNIKSIPCFVGNPENTQTSWFSEGPDCPPAGIRTRLPDRKGMEGAAWRRSCSSQGPAIGLRVQLHRLAALSVLMLTHKWRTLWNSELERKSALKCGRQCTLLAMARSFPSREGFWA